MEAKLKELVKESVLEALVEYANYGVATVDEPVKDTIVTVPSDTTKTDKPKQPGRPGPLIGPSGFSLR